MSNVKIVTFDSSDVIISCVHTDTSGNFVSCDDLSMNNLPCVLNPNTKTSKTHISDVEKGFPYYPYPYPHRPPYYPYLYRDIDIKEKPIDHEDDVKRSFRYDPYYGYGYGYPYNLYDGYDYGLLSDDMDYYRDIDPSQLQKHPVPPHPILPVPFPVTKKPVKMNEFEGTHIHIYPPKK